MKLGAEPKKLAILGSLLLVALVVFFINSGDSSGSPSPTPATAPATALPSPAAGPRDAAAAARPSRSSSNRRETREFRPTFGWRRGEERPDPMKIDPTLHLGILEKLQQVKVEGPRRSVFEFGQAAAPKPEPSKMAAVKPVPVPSPFIGPKPPPKEEPPPPPPPPPPIPLKFYGYANPADKTKRAFFMEGEEIFIATEGELIKRRYRIVRIGVNSAVVEDTEHKNQQTLPLEEQRG